MSKNWTLKKLLGGCVIGAIIGGLLGWVAAVRMQPPLHNEYEQAAEEIYAFYLEKGELPEAGELSQSTQDLFAKNNGIEYSREQGLSYQYEEPYPINVPITGVFTLGFWWGGAETHTNEAQPPDILKHNARIRAN